MELNVHKSYERLGRIAEKIVGDNAMANRALADCTLTIGPASDSRYGTDMEAMYSPTYVGDSRFIGDNKKTAELDALAKKDQNSVNMRFVWNQARARYDVVWGKNKFVGDSLTHDAVDLIGSQALTPWSVNWFRNVFRQPLAWSKARKFVTIENGTDPWAEVMSLPLAQYSGFSALNNAGSPANSKTQDVEVETGMLTAPIINMNVTYKISVEEAKRAETSQAPWAGQLITQKQEYANWVLEMLTDVVIYFGNSATGTNGLFTVNAPTAWSTLGSSLSTIANGSSVTRGSDMYKAFSKALNAYLTTNMNKFPKIMIGMSPLAYNLFTSAAYSDTYDPNSAMKIFMNNYMAGEDKDGRMPDIEIFADPLLAPNTIFNPLSTDYLVITAPEIGTGPDDTPQPLVLFGAPLMEFVYPVVPGQYLTQYKMLRRVAGIFAPYTPAIQVYTGFGQ